ncbi:MAG: hypothetical protein SF028_04150 [Candidatus Sumerlaeia bacterium]|nr:hypothetical protein [Candidatus Sumerlaeia bacterium]
MGAKTVLLCEDDPVLREVLRRSLAREGYDVEVHRPEESLSEAIRRGPRRLGAIVADLRFFERDIKGHIDEVAAGTAVVITTPFCTAHAIHGEHEIPQGVHPLPRPFKIPDLLAILEARSSDSGVSP